MKKKLTLTIDQELIKQLKILAAQKSVTMLSLIEQAIINMTGQGDTEKYMTFGKYSIKSAGIKKEITQKECEDISTVETVLPIKDLTEV